MTNVLEGHNEKVKYNVLGKYSISSNGSRIVISKELNGRELNYGNNTYGAKYFDGWNMRKKAYGKTRSDVLAYDNNFKNNRDNIVSRNTKVKKYYNKNKKRYNNYNNRKY